MSKIDSTKTKRTCETCRYCFKAKSRTNFIWYYCAFHSSPVGVELCLDERHFGEACEKYKKRE